MTEDRETLKHAALGVLVNRALFADDCRRLQEWSMIGSVQRAALDSFAERLLAAERERWTEAVMAELDGNGQAQAIVAYATRRSNG